jgi:hypothetical protein
VQLDFCLDPQSGLPQGDGHRGPIHRLQEPIPKLAVDLKDTPTICRVSSACLNRASPRLSVFICVHLWLKHPDRLLRHYPMSAAKGAWPACGSFASLRMTLRVLKRTLSPVHRTDRALTRCRRSTGVGEARPSNPRSPPGRFLHSASGPCWRTATAIPAFPHRATHCTAASAAVQAHSIRELVRRPSARTPRGVDPSSVACLLPLPAPSPRATRSWTPSRS